ncbi:sulfotransferase family protein [Nocardioides currus]|uniref:Sulfotransferase n=1 Tax=Nocardioides currus TaxID=2133958 RepID=A0A2R7YTN7_9ACTN|nr:sulfotransferase [Nocardioides currus]PUA79757.1 sulfotransferase [Nocardioides currus]
MTRAPRPDFLVIGAPKAGTTALHAALAQHPDVFVSSPKEPKFWLCDGEPPPAWCGPGDKHSQQEWIWREDDYAELFSQAREDQVRGESTPFYLWSRGAHRRIGEALPDVRLIAVVRDPIDRAYSNWMHLWSDGLEPESDFETAFARQDQRVRAGWAPFWRYRDLGRYGEQLEHLNRHVDPERVLVLRYRDLVDDPRSAVDRVSRFLGIREGLVDHIPRDNSRGFVHPGWRPRLAGPVVRGGARLGQFAPPQVWRVLHPSFISLLGERGEAHRPRLRADQRERMQHAFADDIALLGRLTGQDFGDWLSRESRGSFSERAATVTQLSAHR